MASSSEVPQSSPSGEAQPTKGSRLGSRISPGVTKQSGVKGVSWHPAMNGWYARWREGGKVKHRMFCVHKYMKSTGMDYPEADRVALRDAIALREGLVKRGVINKKTTKRSCDPESGGVVWNSGRWQVRVVVDGKKVYGGSFRPLDGSPEEIERARLAAVDLRRKLIPGNVEEEGQAPPPQKRKRQQTGKSVQTKQSGCKGVSWHARMNGWYTRWREGGKQKHQMFCVSKYMKATGKAYPEADAAALHDAISLRERLIKDGVIKAGR